MSKSDDKQVEQSYIQLNGSDGTIYILPYGHLLYCQLLPTEVELVFAVHNVSVIGRNLTALAPHLQKGIVRILQVGTYQPGGGSAAGKDEPAYIERIDIALRPTRE